MNKKDGTGEVGRAMALFTQLGIRMAACVFLGVFGGKALVDRFAAPSWITLVGALFGMAAAFKTMYDLVKEWMK